MANAIRRPTVRLQFSDGQVIVTPQDMDTFVMNAARACEACAEAVRHDERIRQLQKELLLPMHQWCVERAAQVRWCYIPVPVGIIRIYIVTTLPKFDFGLAEEIAALEREFYRSGWRVSLTQLPVADADSLGTFFSQDGALEVYAQSK